MKLKSLFVFSLLVLSFLSWKFIYAGGQTGDTDSPALQVRLRNIGHLLLVQNGDSSSRVLPIKTISDHSFQLKFESDFAVEPDSLVNIVNASLRGLNISQGYVVNVMSCATQEVVYGFEVYLDSKNDVVPCLGRSLPKACYEISISFKRSTGVTGKYTYLFISLMFSLVLGYLVVRKGQAETKTTEENYIQLGKFRFFPEKQLLKLVSNEISLTAKENQVLKIFALNPNETINRDQLQKEVWENEGVVVGRSLDVFISKLRKKLEIDSSIRIVNIHGKGYKLETD